MSKPSTNWSNSSRSTTLGDTVIPLNSSSISLAGLTIYLSTSYTRVASTTTSYGTTNNSNTGVQAGSLVVSANSNTINATGFIAGTQTQALTSTVWSIL